MSRAELRIGKVRELDIPQGLSLEERQAELQRRGFETSEWDDENYIENEKLVVIEGGRIFEVLEDEDYDGADIAKATKNQDGTISYMLKYYNGGTCFAEMIETAILKMEKA